MNPNKANGYDGVSVRMLKLSCPSIIKPLLLIFRNCLKLRTLPDDRKNDNVVPEHKKDSKQIVNNYRPVSLSPIYSKVFEKLVFDAIFKFMIVNNLLSSTQSGFKSDDSCVNQVISITHSIFSAFDANSSLKVLGAFLDLSEAFDGV